jgi:WD40 repeat protein
VRVWNAASGANLAVLRPHTDTVWWAAFSPDGARIVTASWDDAAASGDSLAVLREYWVEHDVAVITQRSLRR